MNVPLVLIEWEDSVQPSAAWELLEDYEPSSAVRIRSVGWLVADGDVKAVAPNFGSVAGLSPQVSGVIHIPARCVLSMKILGDCEALTMPKADAGMSMIEMTSAILPDFPNGLITREIMVQMERRFGRRVQRTSLSPQLSRMQERGLIGRRGVRWFSAQGMALREDPRSGAEGGARQPGPATGGMRPDTSSIPNTPEKG